MSSSGSQSTADGPRASRSESKSSAWLPPPCRPPPEGCARAVTSIELRGHINAREPGNGEDANNHDEKSEADDGFEDHDDSGKTIGSMYSARGEEGSTSQ